MLVDSVKPAWRIRNVRNSFRSEFKQLYDADKRANGAERKIDLHIIKLQIGLCKFSMRTCDLFATVQSVNSSCVSECPQLFKKRRHTLPCGQPVNSTVTQVHTVKKDVANVYTIIEVIVRKNYTVYIKEVSLLHHKYSDELQDCCLAFAQFHTPPPPRS